MASYGDVSDRDRHEDVTLFGFQPMDSEEAPLTLRDLALLAQQGDKGATDDLMASVHQIALRYARARLGRFSGSGEAVADTAQEVCVAVLSALPRYTDRGAPFEASVYRIAANKVADAQRSSMRGPVPTDEVPERADLAPTPEEHAVASDQAADVWRLLDRLSDQHREILTLRIAVGMSADETAAALGMTAGAVRVAQHRALARLRSLYAASGDSR